jgi:hypothetical protein
VIGRESRNLEHVAGEQVQALRVSRWLPGPPRRKPRQGKGPNSVEGLRDSVTLLSRLVDFSLPALGSHNS